MQDFLVVTRTRAVEAVQAALLAANSLHSGEGITDFGGVASFTDSGEVLRVRGDDIARIWPDGQSRPFAWFVTPEDDADADVFTVYYGGAEGIRPVELEQRLLIDGVLHRIGRVQIPGERPRRLDIGLHRSPGVIDARTRSVEIPTAAETRVTKAVPRSTYPVQFGVASGRNLDARVIVYDRSQRRWENLSVRALLAGAYEEPDTATRYVATKESAARPATFTEAELLAGAAVTGVTTGIAAPAVPADAELVWIGVALPAGADFPYFALQGSNVGFNSRGLIFDDDPNDAVSVNGVGFDLYISQSERAAEFSGTGFFAYFDRDAVTP